MLVMESSAKQTNGARMERSVNGALR